MKFFISLFIMSGFKVKARMEVISRDNFEVKRTQSL